MANFRFHYFFSSYRTDTNYIWKARRQFCFIGFKFPQLDSNQLYVPFYLVLTFFMIYVRSIISWFWEQRKLYVHGNIKSRYQQANSNERKSQKRNTSVGQENYWQPISEYELRGINILAVFLLIFSVPFIKWTKREKFVWFGLVLLYHSQDMASDAWRHLHSVTLFLISGYCDISEWHVRSARARNNTCIEFAPN